MNYSHGGDELDIAQLPDFVQSALRSATRSASVGSETKLASDVLESQGAPVWPFLLKAACVPVFLPSEILPHQSAVNEYRLLQRELLRFADTQHTAVGTRWAIQSRPRAAILDAGIASGEVHTVMEPPSYEGGMFSSVRNAMQACILETHIIPPTDLASLECMRAAVNMLCGVKALAKKLPPLAALDREIELRRLLSQFERMTGLEKASTTNARRDRFFGRDDEVERLRAFVAVVGVGVGGRLRNVAMHIKRTIRDVRPLNVFGVGGVGKTTLMSKFMLEHARAASASFPFAYLDFDRAGISARNPGALLIEMALQVGAQFEALAPAMLQIRQDVRQLALTKAYESESSPTHLLPCIERFRREIDAFLSKDESRTEFARPFLLVFDTFELVQYTPSDVKHLEYFVGSFTGIQDESTWSRLRLVIAGRNNVPSFLGPVDKLEIGPLTKKGTTEMLRALAMDEKKDISQADADKLVEAIMRALQADPKNGLHPLRVRLLATQFKRSTKPGTTIIADLLTELSSPDALRGATGMLLIDGFLIRRILDAVGDFRVCALADPGLVVRRITPDVIRLVMARGTTKPLGPLERNSSARALDDAVDYEPWEMSADESEAVFRVFSREESLVDNEGQWLRHRQDVRREMLPLIQGRRPNRFIRLHELAYDYFSSLLGSDSSSELARSEAVYHALWLDRSPAELDALWGSDATFDPRIDPSELSPGSRAAVYLRARSDDRLSVSELRLLPPDIAYRWFQRRQDKLLEDPEVTDVVDCARAVAGEDFHVLDANPSAAATLARVLYRSGDWEASFGLINRHQGERLRSFQTKGSDGDSSIARGADNESMLRTLVTLFAKSGGDPSDLRPLLHATQGIENEVARLEVTSYLTIAQRVAPPRDQVARTERVRPPRELQSKLRILRLVILAEPRDASSLLSVYVQSLDRLPRDPELAPTLIALFSSIYGSRSVFGGDMRPEITQKPAEYARLVESAEAAFLSEKSLFIERSTENRLLQRVIELVRYDHGDWMNPLSHGITLAGRGERAKELRQALSRALPKPWSLDAVAHDGTLDGRIVMQYARDRVGLLRVARELDKAGRSFNDMSERTRSSARPSISTGGFPRNVFELASAFLRWNDLLGRGATPSHPR